MNRKERRAQQWPKGKTQPLRSRIQRKHRKRRTGGVK